MVAETRTRAAVPVAEKYIAQRTQSFTRTHARAMGDFVDQGGTEAEYYERFLNEVTKSKKRWDRDVEQIDADEVMSFLEKRTAKNRLSRVWPAWTEEQESRFVAQYGDPRSVDRGRLESWLDRHAEPQWTGILRGGQEVTIPKLDWELKFHGFLTDPQDGSVPLGMEVRTLGQPEPVVAVPAGLTEGQMAVVERTCRFCARVGASKAGNTRHEGACKDRPSA